MEKETIVIDGVRYTACVTTLTVQQAAEAVSSGRTEKQGALSRRRTVTTWPSLRRRNRPVTAAATAPASASA